VWRRRRRRAADRDDQCRLRAVGGYGQSGSLRRFPAVSDRVDVGL